MSDLDIKYRDLPVSSKLNPVKRANEYIQEVAPGLSETYAEMAMLRAFKRWHFNDESLEEALIESVLFYLDFAMCIARARKEGING